MKKIALFFLLLLAPAAAFCEDMKLASYADMLFDTGDYYRAIGEYKRYIFYNPRGQAVKKAAYRTGICYLYAGKFDEAASVFEKIPENYTGSIAEAAVLAEAWVYFAKKDYQYSSTLAGKLASAAAPALKTKAEYLSGLNRVCQKEYGGGRRCF